MSSGTIRIENGAWETMLADARRTYPNECCGAMLGSQSDGVKVVSEAVPLANAFVGGQRTRYELNPEDLLRADREARDKGLGLIGIYHSHPDCDAYFSETDLKNSCPWYSFVVISIKEGQFDHANCFLPNAEQTKAEPEQLVYPKES